MGTSARWHIPADREPKIERIELGDLAYEGARKAFNEPERMVLTGADMDAFLAVVMDPPEPAEKLVAALGRHRDITR